MTGFVQGRPSPVWGGGRQTHVFNMHISQLRSPSGHHAKSSAAHTSSGREIRCPDGQKGQKKRTRRKKELLGQFENDCSASPPATRSERDRWGGKSPSIPLWQRGKQITASTDRLPGNPSPQPLSPTGLRTRHFAETEDPGGRHPKIPSWEGCRVSGGVGSGAPAGPGQPTPAFGHPSEEGIRRLLSVLPSNCRVVSPHGERGFFTLAP